MLVSPRLHTQFFYKSNQKNIHIPKQQIKTLAEQINPMHIIFSKKNLEHIQLVSTILDFLNN
jgi:hypothetical protein